MVLFGFWFSFLLYSNFSFAFHSLVVVVVIVFFIAVCTLHISKCVCTLWFPNTYFPVFITDENFYCSIFNYYVCRHVAAHIWYFIIFSKLSIVVISMGTEIQRHKLIKKVKSGIWFIYLYWCRSKKKQRTKIKRMNGTPEPLSIILTWFHLHPIWIGVDQFHFELNLVCQINNRFDLSKLRITWINKTKVAHIQLNFLQLKLIQCTNDSVSNAKHVWMMDRNIWMSAFDVCKSNNGRHSNRNGKREKEKRHITGTMKRGNKPAEECVLKY